MPRLISDSSGNFRYACYHRCFIAVDGGTTWENVSEDQWGDDTVDGVFSLIVYNGQLYAGVYGSPFLFRYLGDDNWLPMNTSELKTKPDEPWIGTKSMYVWKGLLILGDSEEDLVAYYDGNTSDYVVYIDDIGWSCIWDFEVYQGRIYASTYNYEIHASEDGLNWVSYVIPIITTYGYLWEAEVYPDPIQERDRFFISSGYKLLESNGSNAAEVSNWVDLNVSVEGEIISMLATEQDLLIGTGYEGCTDLHEPEDDYTRKGTNGSIYNYNGIEFENYSDGLDTKGVQCLLAAYGKSTPSNLTLEKTASVETSEEPKVWSSDLVNNKILPFDENRDEIKYTITYNPNGQADANDVTLTDYLPHYVDFVRAESNDGHVGIYEGSSHSVIWQLGDLSGSSDHTIELYVRLNEGALPGSFISNFCIAENENFILTDTDDGVTVDHWSVERMYVDKDNTSGNENGSSWETAFTTIQRALELAGYAFAPVEIWVAQGTYTGPIYLVDGVSLYGWFAGTENSIDERDLTNPANETIIDGNQTDRVVCLGVEDVIFDGFTITNGKQCGVYCYAGPITISNCTIKDIGQATPQAGVGDGITAISDCDLTVKNCVVKNNYNTGIDLQKYEYVTPVIINNLVCTNGYAGISVETLGVAAIIRNNTIINDKDGNNPSGYCISFDKEDSYGNSPIIRNCILWDGDSEPDNMIGGDNCSNIRFSYLRDANDSQNTTLEPRHNITGVPGFEADTYHLSEGSQCINRGFDDEASPTGNNNTISVTDNIFYVKGDVIEIGLDGVPRIVVNVASNVITFRPVLESPLAQASPLVNWLWVDKFEDITTADGTLTSIIVADAAKYRLDDTVKVNGKYSIVTGIDKQTNTVNLRSDDLTTIPAADTVVIVRTLSNERDIDSEPRVTGGIVDIGADERAQLEVSFTDSYLELTADGAFQASKNLSANIAGSYGSSVTVYWSEVTGREGEVTGLPYDETHSSAPTAVTRAVTFNGLGSYLVQAEVRDSSNNFVLGKDTITVFVKLEVDAGTYSQQDYLGAPAELQLNGSIAGSATIPTGITTEWSCLQPGIVFAPPLPAPNNLTPTVTLNKAGIFSVNLTAKNGEQIVGSDEAAINFITPGNQPPVAEAGPEQIIHIWYGELTGGFIEVPLNGAWASDDGNTGVFDVNWTETNSSADFEDVTGTSGNYTARFVKPGVYNLRITADDSEYTDSDDITVIIDDKRLDIDLPQRISQRLSSGALHVDIDAHVVGGEPCSITFVWKDEDLTTIGDEEDIGLDFNEFDIGVHRYTLTVDDEVTSVTEEITVVVLPEGEGYYVFAGEDKNATMSRPVHFDDAYILPEPFNGRISWQVTSGNGNYVIFDTSSSYVNPVLTFLMWGDYQLELSADEDGEGPILPVSSTVWVYVTAGMQDDTAPAIETITCGETSGDITVNVTASDNIGIVLLELYLDKDEDHQVSAGDELLKTVYGEPSYPQSLGLDYTKRSSYLPVGNKNYVAQVLDAAGLSASDYCQAASTSEVGNYRVYPEVVTSDDLTLDFTADLPEATFGANPLWEIMIYAPGHIYKTYVTGNGNIIPEGNNDVTVPDDGSWPDGVYEAELYVNSALKATLTFSVALSSSGSITAEMTCFDFNLASSGDEISLDNVGYYIDENSELQGDSFPTLTVGLATLLGQASHSGAFGSNLYCRIDIYEPEVENSHTPEQWQYYPEFHVKNLTGGAVNGWRWVNPAAEPGDIFGQLDFSGLANGIYSILLTVKCEVDGTVIEKNYDSSRFLLDCPLKIGGVKFSQEDLSIPVGAMPIRVIRSYDSFERHELGDFGYGWTLSLANMDVELSETRKDLGDHTRRIGGAFDRDVTLTLPDGRRVTFAFAFDPATQDPWHVKYIPPEGVNAKLEALDSSSAVEKLRSAPLGGLSAELYWNHIPIFPGVIDLGAHDFAKFRLTTEDGTEYHIERQYQGTFSYEGYFPQSGGLVLDDMYEYDSYGKPYLQKIVTPSDEEIYFDVDLSDPENPVTVGIEYYLPGDDHGEDDPAKAIQIIRDEWGRIIAINAPTETGQDPRNPGDTPTVVYVYDPNPLNGNLIEVKRLVNVAGEYESTYYNYDDIAYDPYEHYVTDIKDDRGLTPIQYKYNGAGQLIATVDAKGNEIQISHNVTGKTETVTDRSGNITIYEYNNRGNVISVTNSLSQTTLYEYTDNDYPDGPSRVKVPLVPNPASDANYAITTTDYDASGNPLEVTDPEGNITVNVYDSKGNLLTTTQQLPGGAEVLTTENVYKDNGLLIFTGTRKASVWYSMTLNYYDTTSKLLTDTVQVNMDHVNSIGEVFSGGDPNSKTLLAITILPGYASGAHPITSYAYNYSLSGSYDQPYSITSTDGSTRYFKYDAQNNQIYSYYLKAGMYIFSVNYYDSQGRVIQTSRMTDNDDDPFNGGDATPAEEVILGTTVYNSIGKVDTVWDEYGNFTEYDYDELGNLVETRTYDPNGIYLTATQNLYDKEGRVIVTVGPFAAGDSPVGTETLYDALGRVIETRRWADVQIDLVELVVNDEVVGKTVDPNATAANAWDYNSSDPNPVTYNCGWTSNGKIPVIDTQTYSSTYHDLPLSYARTVYDTGGRTKHSLALDEAGDEQPTTYYYDKAGKQTKVVDPQGHQNLPYADKGDTGFRQIDFSSFNEAAHLTGTHTTVTQYEGTRRSSVTDARNNTTSFEYDALGRVIKTTYPEAELDDDGQVNDATYTYVQYDGLGRKKWQSAQTRQTDRNHTDSWAEDIGFRLRRRSFEYDSAGRLIATILPEPDDGAGIPRYDYFYDDYGNLVGILDAKERLSVFEYDHLNRQTVKYMPFVAANPNSISDANDVYTELANASPQPKYQTSGYDEFSRLTKATDYKGQVTGYFYNDRGQLELQKFYDSNALYPAEPNMQYEFTYDNLGRKTRIDVNDFDSGTLDSYSYGYNDKGGISDVTTPQGAVGYDYDGITSQKGTTYSTDNGVDYSYDELGRLESLRVFERNGLDVNEQSDYTYNEVGSRKSLQYANGNYTYYIYDALNRLTSLTNWQDNTQTAILSRFVYQLNADGMRRKVTEQMEEARTIEYDYDDLNRLIQEFGDKGSGEDEYTVDYTYDLVGNRTQRKVTVNNPTSGFMLITSYSYNQDNDRLDVEQHIGPELVAFGWGDRRVYAHADGGKFTKYHIAGEDRDIGSFKAWMLGMPSKWSRYLFRTVSVLLIASFFAPLLIQRRDKKYRLSFFHSGLCILIAFVMFVGPEGFYQLANADVLFSQLDTTDWSSGNRKTTYTYDDNGSVTQKVTAKLIEPDYLIETVNYTYNLQNRLVRVETIDHVGSTTTVVAYKYNPDGIRVAKIEDPDGSPVTTDYLIDAYNHTGYSQVFIETKGASRTAYTIGLDIISQAEDYDEPSDLKFLLCDGHGSVRQLTNNTGSVITGQNFSYDGYGVMLGGNPESEANPSSAGTNLLYCGEQFDTDLQQYYLRARYYNQNNGRFNRIDPFSGDTQDPQSLHKYLYCHANAVNAVDPSGNTSLIGTTLAIANMLIIRAMELAPTLAAYAWAVTKIAGITFLATTVYLGLAQLGWVPDNETIALLQQASFVVFLAAFMATGMLNAVPRVKGKVPYGSTHLSKQVQSARINGNFRVPRNITVFEYKDNNGSLKTILTTSSRGIPGGGHAERVAGRLLESMNIPNSKVTQIYSELQPCDDPGGYCAEYIRRTFPQASVSWSFDYADPATRAQGKAEWLESISRLFDGWLF